MKVGTKSLLFGVHQFLIHPVLVAWAWKKLFGFPWDPRLWLAIFIHDWGYWGKKKMDDRDGARHVEFAAHVIKRFDYWKNNNPHYWFELCFFHSRSYCKWYNGKPSELCYADKLAISLYPDWLYLLLGKASGEIYEYMEEGKNGKYQGLPGQDATDPKVWLKAVKIFSKQWAEENVQERRHERKRRIYAATT